MTRKDGSFSADPLHNARLFTLQVHYWLSSAKLLAYSLTVLPVCYCRSVPALSADILVVICCSQHLLVVCDSYKKAGNWGGGQSEVKHHTTLV